MTCAYCGGANLLHDECHLEATKKAMAAAMEQLKETQHQVAQLLKRTESLVAEVRELRALLTPGDPGHLPQ